MLKASPRNCSRRRNWNSYRRKSKPRKPLRMRAVAERTSNVETVRSTTSVIESEGNAAVVAEEEAIAGEVVEETIET